MHLALALAGAVLALQDTDEITKHVEHLKSGKPDDRKAATAALIQLRKRDPKNADALRAILEKEPDETVKARLRYVLYGVALTRKWKQTVPDPTFVWPLAAEENWVAVVATRDADERHETVLHLLAAKDGKSAPPLAIPGGVPAAAPVIAGDAVLILTRRMEPGDPRYQLHRCRLSDRKSVVLWKGATCERWNADRCALADGKHAILRLGHKEMACFDATSTTQAWSLTKVETLYCAVSDGRVFYVDDKFQLTCAEIGDATKSRWKADARAAYGVLGVSGDRVIALAQPPDELKALSLKDGKEVWASKPPEQLWGADEWAITDQHMVIRTRNSVLCFESATGKLVWSGSPGVAKLRSLAVVEGCAAIAEDGRFTLLDLAGGSSALDPDLGLGAASAVAVAGNRLYVLVAQELSAYEVTR